MNFIESYKKGVMIMLSVNENIFSKEIVKTFFDLKIKVKYAILRLKNLEYYIGKEKSTRYLLG